MMLYDALLSDVVASFVVLLIWFILSGINDDDKSNDEHDKELFKQPPPAEDCPICFLQLPSLRTGWKYKTCCGKIICSGCSYAPVYDDRGNIVDNPCPYCRTPFPTSDEEMIEREKKRVEVDDPI